MSISVKRTGFALVRMFHWSENSGTSQVQCIVLYLSESMVLLGIGNIPDQVLSCLWSHRDLGIHSEMFSDGLIDLVEHGVITNAQKKVQPGKIVGGFCLGSKRLYEFLDDNPFIGQ